MSPLGLLWAVGAGATGLPPGVPLPIPVSTAVVVERLSALDEASGTFDATVDVSLSWRDPSLAFDRRARGTDREVLLGDEARRRLSEMWDPGVELANLSGEPASSEVSLQLHDDGRVEWLERLDATFELAVDLGRFPFDTQTPGLRLVVPAYNARQVTLVHTQDDIERSGLGTGAVTLPEWRPRGLRFEPGEERGLDGLLHPTMTVGVRLTRVAGAYVGSLFAPLVVILLLPVLCIWVRTDIHERINWVVTAVFSLIALNFSVSIEYPALGVDSGFMSLFWYGYVAQGVALGLIMVLFNEGRLARWFGPDLLDEAVDCLSWALPAVLLVAFGDVLLALAL